MSSYVPCFFNAVHGNKIMKDQDVGDLARESRSDLAVQIIRCIILGALIAYATWLIANFVFDWAGYR